MASNYNYYAVIRSLIAIDPINGIYSCKYYVMNQSTIGASTQFWQEGMSTGTPLSSPPSDASIPAVTLSGTTIPVLTQALQNQCQSLAARLTAMTVTPISITPGTITPVTLIY